MAEAPKISVVTPCLNSVGTIGATIQSVLDQDYTNWEHIVVDGGSTDGTVAVLQQYPRLNWVSEKDEGHYHAMNKGLDRATGDAVVILNADDCFRAGALRKVATAFQQHPDWDALFGDVVFVDGQGREIYRREEAVYDFKVLLYGVDYICHQTLFVRRATYARLGGYRHKDFRNATDYEFKLRLGHAGCRVGHVPALLVDYRYRTQGQSADRRIIRNMIQEAAVIRREYGHPGGRRSAPLRILFKAKRQLQKLWLRRKCDLIPGTWRLKPHLQAETQFSSNAGLDKL
ncbi:MAG TPA: glycosyltransferase family 2 protein [Verrucomicrobiota bacterium]|nr:glycosyltransferase family 2 protein [Verrucomicrobiota bacterium]